jgi:hypothetical protein
VMEGTSVECCQWQEARDQHIFLLHVRLEEEEAGWWGSLVDSDRSMSGRKWWARPAVAQRQWW